MSRSVTLLIVGIVMFTSPVASGDVFCVLWHEFSGAYHRNKQWPHPYDYMDNMAARAPFGVMTHNGWRLQNLVADHHFEPDTAELNEAGKRHVWWVMTQTPIQRRIVYVEQTMSPDLSAERLRSVHATAARYAVGDQMVDVRPTHITSPGVPADYVDAVNQKFRESTPDPRLPSESSEISQ